MFLPIVMLQRWGWPGFLAFAIPNVIGCAAFGYVLNRSSSARLLTAHGPAMRGFSAITIGYHGYFAAFAAGLIAGSDPWMMMIAAPLTLVVGGGLLSLVPTRWWPGLALAVYGVSIAAFAQIGFEPLTTIDWRGEQSTIALLWLAPTLCFGFLLCPYLDLTFHRARQETGGTGPEGAHAFTVFGIAFAVMILFTCAYRDQLNEGIALLLIAHLAIQSIFTVGAHLREMRIHAQSCGACGIRWSIAALLLALGGGAIAIGIQYLTQNAADFRDVGVNMYLRWLVFYGLIAPAYVLLFIGPGPVIPRTRSVMVGAMILILLALPMYEFGFIHHQTWLLPIPLVALIAWKFAARATQAGPERSAATQAGPERSAATQAGPERSAGPGRSQ